MNLLLVDLATDAVNAYDLSYPWTKVLTYGDSYVGLLIDSVNKRLRVAFQGTRNLDDGLKDAAALIPHRIAGIGPVPYGFQIGMPETYSAIHGLITPDWIVTLAGHSLGAAQAAIVAAMFVLDGLIPSAVALLECPRVGSAVAAMLAKIKRLYNYANAGDIVVDVPSLIAPPAKAIQLNWPVLIEPADPIERHSAANVLAGIKLLNQPAFEALPCSSIVLA